MTHERNVDGLRKSAQLRHQQALERADEGIRRLLKEGRPVNFTSVADVAHVSTAWLYQQAELRERIEHARAHYQASPLPSPKTRVSDASKEAMLAALRLRVRRVEEDNRELKQQIEVLYGQLYKQKP
jgi:hypothetical protein